MIWGDVFFTEVKGNYRKIYTVSITDYTGSINLKVRAQEGRTAPSGRASAKAAQSSCGVTAPTINTSTTTSCTPMMC